MGLRRTWMLLAGLLLVTATSASGRKWTDATGKYTVEAELVDKKGRSVRLKRQDGHVITVAVSNLSIVDGYYLEFIEDPEQKPDVDNLTQEEVIAFLKKRGMTVKIDKSKAVTELQSPFLSKYRHRPIIDAVVEYVKVFPNLKRLSLTATHVTDAGLEHLKGLKNLQYLELIHTNVTDVGLKHLSGLKDLRRLSLRGTDITNAGLKHLKGMANLTSLDLGDTDITDAGLEHLKGIANLRHIGLSGTATTEAGRDKIQTWAYCHR